MDLELALNLTADGDDLRAEVRLSKGELDKLHESNEKVGRSGRNAGDGLDKGSRGARRWGNQARQASRRSTSLSGALSKVARVAGTLTGILGGISFAVLAQDMASTIHTAELLEGALLSAVGGIPELADQAFAALEGFASRTPFALEQSVNAFIKMQNLGILPTEERMAAFGNTASAMGKDLNQMIEAVADASTGEFERLKEFGIKARQEGENVSFTFQGVTTTVQRDSEAIVEYLTNIGNVNFGDAMQNQMERLPGLWSNLKDSIEGVWRDLGDAGATDTFERWLRAGIDWIGNIRQAIQAGWFDWVGAELDAQLVRFSGWADLARDAWSSLIDLWENDEGLQSPGFIDDLLDDIAELPINLQTLAAIGIAEFDKLRFGAIQKIRLLVNSGKQAWEDLSFSIRTMLSGIELAAAQAVESVIQEFGRMVSQLGETLAAINSTSLGDALVPDDALAKIQSAGVAMQNYRGLTEGVQADTAAAATAHRERSVALEAERAGINAAAEAQREAADEFIQFALENRDASIAARAAKQQEAEAAAESARATYEQNKALKSTAPTIDDVTGKLKKQGAETGKVNQALEDLLDELFDTRRVMREYEADLGTLEAALAKGEISQDEFNAAVARLRTEASESLGGIRSFTEEMAIIYENTFDQLDDIGREFWNNFLRNGELSADSVLDLVEGMLAEISYAFARNQVLQYFGVGDGGTGGGFSGLISAALKGNNAPTGTSTTGGTTGVTEGGTTGVTGASAAGAGTVATAAWAALVIGIFRTLDDLQNGRYGLGDVLTANNLNIKYADSFGPLGDFLFPQGKDIESFGFAAAGDPLAAYAINKYTDSGTAGLINNLTGFKNGGNNAARGSFDLGTGRTNAFGVGNNFSERNLSNVEQLLERFSEFAASIGGSTFSGNIKVGNRSGFAIDGDKFKDPDEFMAAVFEDIVRNATNLNEEVQDIILSRRGDAEAVQRNTSDAQLLNTLLRRQGSVFTDVEGLTPTFDVLADQFRGEAEGFTEVFERFELGLVIMDELGESTERTVANMQRATQLVDQLGVETARGVAATLDILGEGLDSQFSALQESQVRTSRDILDTLTENNRALLASYDGSAEAARDLANATQARREAEIALLSELDAVTASITGRISTFREQLILDGLDTDGQYERYQQQIADLGAQIATAASAAELDRISSEADRLGRAAFGLLDEDQRDINRAGFLEWLDAIEQAALERSTELREDVIETSEDVDAETRTAIWQQAGLAGERLEGAAADLQTAAQEQQVANIGQAENIAAMAATIEQWASYNQSQDTLIRALIARLQSREPSLAD